jgi:hypothetical protein
MSSSQSGGQERALNHMVYDRTNGRILGRFRRYDVTRDEYCECAPDEVLALFSGDDTIVSRVTDGDMRKLAVLTTTLTSTANPGALSVSENRRALVSRARIRLRADRDLLEGNGEDSITVYIDVVDDQGRVLRDYQGEIHVSTDRGKLSARGGQVAVQGGQGSLTLTSVRETVDRVWVRAKTLDDSAMSDALLLRFE